MAQRDADPKSIKDVLGAFVETNKFWSVYVNY